MGLKSAEYYKANGTGVTYAHCIKKKVLLDLMETFPVAHSIFAERASKRRIEFRRIKKQYEMFADVHPVPEIDMK